MSPLNQKMEEMLKNVEWGEFKLEELFEVKNIKGYDEGKLNLSKTKNKGYYDFIGRTRNNNGIKGYIKKLKNEPNPGEVISISQIGTIVAQIRKYEWYGSQNIFMLSPNDIDRKLISLFVVSAVNKSLNGNFSDGYGNYPTLGKLKKMIIQLPTKNGKIDFDFMEKFIEEIEKEKIRKLEKYLEENNLKDCTLTSEEKQVLEDFENGKVEWGEFKLGDLFEINSSKKNFHANNIREIFNEQKNNTFPYVVRTTQNNGIRGYIDENIKYLNDSNTLSFAQDTFSVFYQKQKYFTGNKVKILRPRFENQNGLIMKFFTVSFQKALSNLSWGTGSTVKTIAKIKISLPVKNNNPDFEKMEILISAVEKLVVKNIIKYINKNT